MRCCDGMRLRQRHRQAQSPSRRLRADHGATPARGRHQSGARDGETVPTSSTGERCSSSRRWQDAATSDHQRLDSSGRRRGLQPVAGPSCPRELAHGTAATEDLHRNGELENGMRKRAVRRRVDGAEVVRGALRRAARGRERSDRRWLTDDHLHASSTSRPGAACMTAAGRGVLVGTNCDVPVPIAEAERLRRSAHRRGHGNRSWRRSESIYAAIRYAVGVVLFGARRAMLTGVKPFSGDPRRSATSCA